jgi:hypothetical protein
LIDVKIKVRRDGRWGSGTKLGQAAMEARRDGRWGEEMAQVEHRWWAATADRRMGKSDHSKNHIKSLGVIFFALLISDHFMPCLCCHRCLQAML